MRLLFFRKPRQRLAKAQQGVTLVELMVAMVLGLILVGGVLNVFLTNRQTFKLNENMARMQENARTAFDLMARDLREAGATPCGVKLLQNVVRKDTVVPWWADWHAGTVRGIRGQQDVTDMAAFGTSINSRVEGTDGLLVLRSAQDEKIIASHNTGTSKITLNDVSGLNAQDIMLACDQHSAAIFQIKAVDAPSKEVSHDDTAPSYNCSKNLGAPPAPLKPNVPNPYDCTKAISKTFAVGGMVAELVSSFWYIGHQENGTKSLYRTRIIKKAVGGSTEITTEPDEIIRGVENLQVEYLTRNSVTGTLAADWVFAHDPESVDTVNPVFSAANGAWTESNLNQVVALRLTLTLQSSEKVGSDQQPIQRQLIHVVSLRSRETAY